MTKFLRAVLLSSAFCVMTLPAFAVQTTPTPPVAPEDGENSSSQSQIVDVARLKIGFGTITAGGTAAAATATLNFASGQVTWPANLTIVSNAQATLTLTDSKIQAGDIVQGWLDDTGAAAGICGARRRGGRRSNQCAWPE